MLNNCVIGLHKIIVSLWGVRLVEGWTRQGRMICYVSRKGCEGNLSWIILKVPGNSRTLSRSMMLLKYLYSLKCCRFYCMCLGLIFIGTYDKTVLEELVPYFSFTTYRVLDTKRTAYKSSSKQLFYCWVCIRCSGTWLFSRCLATALSSRSTI